MPDLTSYLTEDAAAYLIGKAVSLVGFDGISIDHPEKAGAHLLLLRAGVIIVECLDLSSVSAGRYELICLPLRIAEGDGAPARALLRRGEYTSLASG
jgi:arylformamidase